MWLLKCTDCFNFVFWLLTCLSILQNMSFWNGCQKLLCRLNDTLLEHCGCWDAAKGLLSYLII